MLLDDLHHWCLLANEAAYKIQGVRNTCIATSHALVEFLRLEGLEAEVFRAVAGVHCLRHEHDWDCHGSVAGRDPDVRLPKSDGWRGHLAVSCGDYVLDPTFDQLGTSCGLQGSPVVFVKPEGWDVTPSDRPWEGGSWYRWRDGDLSLKHARYRRQVGWKSKGAARPSSWLPIVALMNESPRKVSPRKEIRSSV